MIVKVIPNPSVALAMAIDRNLKKIANGHQICYIRNENDVKTSLGWRYNNFGGKIKRSPSQKTDGDIVAIRGFRSPCVLLKVVID